MSPMATYWIWVHILMQMDQIIRDTLGPWWLTNCWSKPPGSEIVCMLSLYRSSLHFFIWFCFCIHFTFHQKEVRYYFCEWSTTLVAPSMSHLHFFSWIQSIQTAFSATVMDTCVPGSCQRKSACSWVVCYLILFKSQTAGIALIDVT